MPEIWESAFEPTAGDGMNAAADSDGLSNLSEYRAGTDPTSALSFLKLDYVAGEGRTVLRFGAVSNRTYSVQYAEEVAGTAWNKVADIVAYNTNRIETLVDPVVPGNRFYRVVTPALP